MTSAEIVVRIQYYKDCLVAITRRVSTLEQYKIDMPHKCYGNFLDDTIIINKKMHSFLNDKMIPKLERNLRLSLD